MAGPDELDDQERRERWQALGIRTDVAHPARVYDYLLGGKDNISQEVSAIPHNGSTVAIQARQANDSKITSFAVRSLSCTYIGINVRFVGRGFLTLA
jgi:S-adenosyl methyltransferase